MRTVMHTWDLTALLRKVSDRFRFTWNNQNHYREMGVYFDNRFLCGAEQGVMALETKVEDDPLFAMVGNYGKPYWRRSWPSFLILLCGQLRKYLGLLGADLADRVKKEAKKMHFDFTGMRFAG